MDKLYEGLLQRKWESDKDALWEWIVGSRVQNRILGWDLRRDFMKAQHQCCLLILGLLSGTAFAAGVTDGIITEALIIFGLMAIPVVIFRLYFTLGRSQIMRRQLWNRFLWLTSFLLSEIGFYCGFAYLIVLSTHWEMAFELIASFFALIAIIFSLVQHHLLGPTSDGIRARLIYAASLFAYPFMLLSLIWISD